MSRLSSLKPEAATGATAELFAKIRKAVGKVPNAYATIGTHSPEALGAMLAVDGVVASGTLSKPDIETIKLAVSEAAGCDYCLAAHTLAGKFAGLSPETMKHVRAGEPTGDAKRDALVRFVRALVGMRGTVPESEVAAIREAGYSERQLIEIALAITSITFTNLVNRLNDTTLDFPAVA
ncbi:carboxymuconolactone decarboxylase family protein [Paraburkholderia caballeronis]|uniref:carboxymuconolactone decarboxylase family protein n=1 Tax=Paraburkholderia caballeronis TaxID=416943 RepID=UPI001064B31A|nr:carboxymuconolactone decarboxylase family protein [Paraburkholderia caballeronis]TDV09202.1 putative peroxidase-related enzyme [Paraburkholderia caballeronis]TDV12262.1 putative peroxidase-related enzyme [Paraburkholderia caballeronis]TDV22735.1 putative peroxidase-related enzyme [Paraburkholderia caballeronis]